MKSQISGQFGGYEGLWDAPHEREDEEGVRSGVGGQGDRWVGLDRLVELRLFWR